MSRYPYISARSKFSDVISKTVLSVVLIGFAYVDAESLRKARPQGECHYMGRFPLDSYPDVGRLCPRHGPIHGYTG